MVTKQDCLTHSTFYHTSKKNADGTPVRCRANGKCKTWKTRPQDFRLPVKYGLKTCFYLTPRNASEWSTTEGEPPAKRKTMGELHKNRDNSTADDSEIRSRFEACYAKGLQACESDSRVVGVMQEYLSQWFAVDLNNTVLLGEALYQIRHGLSDVIRDAGIDDEDVHEMCLEGWGSLLSEQVLHAYRQKQNLASASGQEVSQ